MFVRKFMILLATLGLSIGSVAAAEHHHGHEHGAAPARLVLNNGKKWPTDEALRQGMDNIRNSMAASLHGIHENKLSQAQYAELAKQMQGEIGNIVANCKLEPKADAQLHIVVADITEGAEAMASPAKKAKRQGGALRIIAALDKYSAYFDHPGWKAIAH